MAKRTPKTKQSQKRSRRGLNAPSKIVAGLAVFAASLTIMLLSFISLELALLGFGVFALFSTTYLEARRRGHWEAAASFKFKTLEAAQENLSKETILNSRDIDEIKDDIKGLRGKSGAQTTPAPEKAKAPSRFITRRSEPFEMENLQKKMPPIASSPRASKPQLPKSMPDTPASGGEEQYEDLSDNVVRELIHHAMAEKRVDVFVQPIVRLPQRQVRFYEMFGRIRARPGQYLPASRYMQIAEQDNLDAEIDNLLLMHCIKTIDHSAHIEAATPFFINIKTSTLKNMAFMKRLLGFLAKNRDLAPRMVFEMKHSDFVDLPPALLEIIRGLGTLGCSLSLDHAPHLEMDIEDLQNFKVRFVKIDAKKLLASSSEKAFAAVHKQKRKLEANGIGVIIEKIENEEAMRELLDFDIHYGQGYLFGKPELEGAYKKRNRARRVGPQEDVA